MKREINVENFLYINNRVLCDGEDWYGFSYCGVCPDDLDCLYITGDTVGVEYQVPYEDWIDTWELPKIYFSMIDEEILSHAKAKYEAKQKAEEEWEYNQDMLTLIRLADKLGYNLTKKEDV